MQALSRPVARDIVREKLKTCLVVPNATRWNSFFNSVDKLRDSLEKAPEDVVAQVFQAFGVVPFTDNQQAFLVEYCTVMEPLARALDTLQGDKNLYIGYLLPTLVSLRNRLQSLKPGLKHAGPLVEALLTGIDHRIHGNSERYDLILASAPYPN